MENDKKTRKLEQGLLRPIVRELWPIGTVSAGLSFVLFAGSGRIGEMVVHAAILMGMVALWPSVRRKD